ncbi:MAG: tetratricopeptide repeat protein [Planctomycetota bacterium]
MAPLLDLEAQAQWLMQRAEFERARVILEHIIERSPDNAIVNEMRGVCLTRLGEYEQARAVLEQVLKQRPDRALAAFHLALCHERTGQLARACELYALAVKLDERYAPAHLRLGNILWAQGDQAGARPHYERYLALEPGDPPREAAVRERLQQDGG